MSAPEVGDKGGKQLSFALLNKSIRLLDIITIMEHPISRPYPTLPVSEADTAASIPDPAPLTYSAASINIHPSFFPMIYL